jgi:transcription elongation factor Elf1
MEPMAEFEATFKSNEIIYTIFICPVCSSKMPVSLYQTQGNLPVCCHRCNAGFYAVKNLWKRKISVKNNLGFEVIDGWYPAPQVNQAEN